MISIPCSIHGNCESHKHHVVRPQPISPQSLVGNETQTEATATPKSAPIQRLPTELLLNIFGSMGAVDSLNFSLACRSFATIFEDSVPAIRGKRPSWDWKAAEECNAFLRILESDLRDRYWHCEACVVLHARSLAPTQTPSSKLGTLLSILPRFGAQAGDPNSYFDIRLLGAPIYNLTFATAHAVVARQRCRESLRCYGWHNYRIQDRTGSERETRVEYSFHPKIVLDRLLVKATYAWDANHGGPPEGSFVERDKWRADQRKRIAQILKDIGLRICHHTTACMAVQALDRCSETRESLRCKYCPTEFCVVRDDEDVYVELRVWQNMGSCETPDDIRWSHMSSNIGDSPEYAWEKRLAGGRCVADEDIRTAYEYIDYECYKDFEKAHGGPGRQTWSSSIRPNPLGIQGGRSFHVYRSVAETL